MENGNTIKGAGKSRVFSFVERFRKPLPGELSEWVRVGSIADRLRKPVIRQNIGRAMRPIGFERKRTAAGTLCNVVSVQKGVEDGEV